jgi:hypothetical protein
VDEKAPALVSGDPEARSPGRRKPNLASNLFAVAAVLLAILAVVFYLRDSGGGVAPIPTAAPGNNQIVNVTEALKAQGLDVRQPPGRFIPAGALQAPGQGIEVNGSPGFVFLYPDAGAAVADAQSASPDAIVPERLSGTPVPAGERRMVQGSNVILLLVGGDEETWRKVEAAVASLP